MKHLFVSVVSALLVLSVSAFDRAEKNALFDISNQLETSLRTAKVLDGKAITLLPVRGDQEGYFGELLLESVVSAGKTCVIPDNEKDARFKKILSEIKWSERQTTLQTIDPATVNRLGKLMSTQIFLEATLDITKERRSIFAEVSLRAYAIETKQYIWVKRVRFPQRVTANSEPVSNEAWWLPVVKRTLVENSQLRVKVASKVDNKENLVYAGLLDAAITEEVVKLGCITESALPPDILVTLLPIRQVYDRTGEYAIFEGTVQAMVRAVGTDNRILGDRVFSARGKRGLGDVAAEKNLVAVTVPQISSWLAPTLTTSTSWLTAIEFEFSLGGAVQEVADLKASELVLRSAASMEGVRSAVILSEDRVKGTFKYRVVYESTRYPGNFLNQLLSNHPELEKVFTFSL